LALAKLGSVMAICLILALAFYRWAIIRTFADELFNGGNDPQSLLGMLDRHPWLARTRLPLEPYNGTQPALIAVLDEDPNEPTPPSARLALVRKMIECGADPNGATDDGRNVLWYAVFKNDPPLVSYLLAHGTKPFTGEEGGVLLTPMQIACRHALKGTVAAIAQYDETSVPALHVAALLGDNTAVARFIHDGRSAIDQLDALGRTPLDYAYFGRNHECILLLKRAGGRTSKQMGGGPSGN